VGRHLVVVVTRSTAIPVLSSLVCVLVTSTFHDHVAEVQVGGPEGLGHDSATSCANLFTLPVSVLTRRRGQLGPAKLLELDGALMIAIALGLV